MVAYSAAPRRSLTVIAQDPGVMDRRGQVIMTQVEVPAEKIAPGPRGHRVHVVDYDSTTDTFYRPRASGLEVDLLAKVSGRDEIDAHPHLHAQNAYAIVSSTLLTFEAALGRHVSWSFEHGTHQLKVAPHAFADANAFYSRKDEGLMFGYFRALNGKRTIFTCLSQDIVVHETTHALLDGLRRQYMRPSSADQAAFHEGYADIIALLSVLRSKEMIEHALAALTTSKTGTTRLGDVYNAVMNSFLTGLADEMGREMEGLNRDALRRSSELDPSPRYYNADERYKEPHSRGEILVAAVMQAFLRVWWRRLLGKLDMGARTANKLTPEQASRRVELWRAVEEGATTAQHLLNMLIRALDYMPPVDILFSDFLSAAITADAEAQPDDSRYNYRAILLDSFAGYGIKPSSSTRDMPGRWEKPATNLEYGHSHFDSMRWDREAVFRFIWENRDKLKLIDQAFTTVESVRPVVRLAPDGFVLREVVAEYFQLLTIPAGELKLLKLRIPDGMPSYQPVRLYGGGTLIFDEFGQLKFEISNRLNNQRQNDRLEELWQRGAFRPGFEAEGHFAQLHRNRALQDSPLAREQW